MKIVLIGILLPRWPLFRPPADPVRPELEQARSQQRQYARWISAAMLLRSQRRPQQQPLCPVSRTGPSMKLMVPCFFGSFLTIIAGRFLPSMWLSTAMEATIGSAPRVSPPTADTSSSIIPSISFAVRYAPSGLKVTRLQSM